MILRSVACKFTIFVPNHNYLTFTHSVELLLGPTKRNCKFISGHNTSCCSRWSSQPVFSLRAITQSPFTFQLPVLWVFSSLNSSMNKDRTRSEGYNRKYSWRIFEDWKRERKNNGVLKNRLFFLLHDVHFLTRLRNSVACFFCICFFFFFSRKIITFYTQW